MSTPLRFDTHILSQTISTIHHSMVKPTFLRFNQLPIVLRFGLAIYSRYSRSITSYPLVFPDQHCVTYVPDYVDLCPIYNLPTVLFLKLRLMLYLLPISPYDQSILQYPSRVPATIPGAQTPPTSTSTLKVPSTVELPFPELNRFHATIDSVLLGALSTYCPLKGPSSHLRHSPCYSIAPPTTLLLLLCHPTTMAHVTLLQWRTSL
eukprot:jgi/Psemu1/68519/estExt_Genemark1.C_5190034